MDDLDQSKTYIFEGTEVKPTGRKAKREIPRPRGEPVISYVFEITPVDETGWLKWVKREELYTIEG